MTVYHMHKITLVGYPGSQKIVPASKYLVSKYLPQFAVEYLNYEGPIEGWADYLVKHFSAIEDDKVIMALDDYLIAGPINMKAYRDAESYLNSPEIACVKLCICSMKEHKEYPCTTQYTLWRRTDLIDILKQVQTPWEFETRGSKLLKKGALLETCIPYFANSSLSNRWEGINLTGLKQEDIDYMVNQSLLPKQEPKPNVVKSSNDKIVVFGGSGYLGTELIKRLIETGHKNILAVARNERALVLLKEKYPLVKIMVGDISDAWSVRAAMVDATEIFLASAMKHVGFAESNVNACILTNIIGVMNVVNESLNTKPKVLMFISTDKAAQGNGVYGCSKKIAERLMSEAERMNPDTKYRVVRYGNIFWSHGAIATKWKPKMEKGEEVIITDQEASRFFWTVEEAIDLIFECIEKSKDSTPYIPKMKAARMGVVLEAMMEVYCDPTNLSPIKRIGLQPGENKVETMDGVIFSDQCEQFTKEEFIEKFLGHKLITAEEAKQIYFGGKLIERPEFIQGLKPKITCILITRETEYPEIVLERLDLGFFDEILVVAECPSIYHRYLAAKQAKNDIVFVVDDDCLVNYQELFKHYNGQITCAMPKDFIQKYKDTGVCLVGWGCYFPKSMLSVFDKYIEKYGEDDPHLAREADRIFTFLNQPHNVVCLPHEDLFQTSDRMGYQENHYESMSQAIEKVKNL